jgi:hypothetical protein
MDAVAWAMRNAPFPILAHRTGRADFPHPALRLASPLFDQLIGALFLSKNIAMRF